MRFEIISRTRGRLRRTSTRAQHWIRHIFSHRTPTIDWNKPSYAQDSVRFLEIIKSRIHQQTVQICSRKGAKLYYDKMIALWYRTEPMLYITNTNTDIMTSQNINRFNIHKSMRHWCLKTPHFFQNSGYTSYTKHK